MNITLKAAAAFLAAALAASCVFEKENPTDVQQRYRHALVQIGVNTDNMTQTRTEGDVVNKGEHDGTTVETVIKSLRVYAYTQASDGTKTLCGYVSAENVTSASTLVMDIMVPFSQTGTTQNVFFMAVANEAGMTGTSGIIINEIGRNPVDGSLVLPSNFSWGSFAGIVYSVNDQTFSNGMPMYCQTTTTVDVNLASTTTPITTVTLDLTRSLSKIEVYAAEAAAATTAEGSTETTSITVTGVSFANVPQAGNLFNEPAADATLTYNEGYTSATLANGGAVVKKVNKANTTDVQNSANYTQVSQAYYLAENNIGADATYDFGYQDYTDVEGASKATVVKIAYKIGSGSEMYGYVQMPKIERNTYYKVLARFLANGKAEIKVIAIPWTLNEEEIVFTDIVSMTGISWTGDGTYNSSTATCTMGAGSGQDATCEFNIATPVDGTWYATIEGKDIQDFTFVKTNADNTEVTSNTVSGSIGTANDMSFTIRTLKTCDVDNNYRTVNIRLVAVTKYGSRSYNVKVGENSHFTIEQRFN